MVGYVPGKERSLSSFDIGLAGGISGAVTRVLIQPLDVLKIRFQLQVEPLSRAVSSAKYHGVVQAFRTIRQEEGIIALWKGHTPAQILSVLFGVVQFTAFEYLTKHAHTSLPSTMTTGKGKPVYHFFCGGVSGCAATIVSQPMDVIRTRLVAQGEPKIYTSTSHAIRLMYKEAGLRTFYKGLLPTLLQLFPHAGFQFSFYTLFTSTWEYAMPRGTVISDSKGAKAAVCGCLSGLCSKTAVYPLDMVKKRLQVQGFEQARVAFGRVQRYDGLRHCIVSVVKQEGVLGLYKGLSPSLLKAMATVGLIFTTYELCCDWLRKSSKYSNDGSR